MLNITIYTDLFRLAPRLEDASQRAAHAAAIQAEKDTSPYVPALTGSLDRQTRVENNQIVYPGPYARFLYFGKVMVDPATGSPFAPRGGTKVVTDKNLVFSRAMHAQAQAFWFEASKAENLDKWLRVAGKALTRYG